MNMRTPIGEILKNKWFYIPVIVFGPWVFFYGAIAPFEYVAPWAAAVLFSCIAVATLIATIIFALKTLNDTGDIRIAFLCIWIVLAGLVSFWLIPEADIRQSQWVVHKGKLYDSQNHNGAFLNMEEGTYKLITGINNIATYLMSPTSLKTARASEQEATVNVTVGYMWQPSFVQQNLDLNYIKTTDDIIFPLLQNNPKALTQVQLVLKVCEATTKLGYKNCPLEVHSLTIE